MTFRMRKILLCAAFGLLAMGCSDKEPRDMAAEAAKAYYDSLMAGGYGYFVDGVYRADSIPSTYRDQLVVNAKMFVYGLKEEHNGVNNIRILRSSTDSVRNVTSVFLMLCFGDSVNEEIVVPMVEKDGKWLMK